jgi:hypothetical protein
MVDVGLAALASHVFVGIYGKLEGFPYPRTIGPSFRAITNAQECAVSAKYFAIFFF